MEEEETYIEVPTEEEIDDYEDDVTFNDIALIIFVVILGCAVFAFAIRTISKHLKNVHLKVGNKIEIGLEAK